MGGSVDNEEQQRATHHGVAPQPTNANPHNAPVENPDSCNGGLVFSENAEVQAFTKEDIIRILALPNSDLSYTDVEKMVNKPRMAQAKKQRTGKVPSRNSYASNKEVPSFTAPPLSPGHNGKGSSFHE